MRLFWTFMLVIISWLPLLGQSGKYDVLDVKLDEYVASMEGITVQEKFEECDFVISHVADSEARNHVAVYLYSKFLNSKLMGDDAVAIYLVDNWFAPGKVSFQSYDDFATAKVFADFNRQSLIGKKAPSLCALQPGDSVAVEALPADGRLKVLFIYNTSCRTCEFETTFLQGYFSDFDTTELDFIAFYSGDDASSWSRWRDEKFSRFSDKVNVKHFWDPTLESDFQRKFGVLSTPRMFLISGDGTILGRSLNTMALKQLIVSLLPVDEYEYGREDMMQAYAAILSDRLSPGGKLTADYVVYTASAFSSLLEPHTRDTLKFKHYIGDLLYFIAGQRKAAFQDAIPYVADSLILSRPDIWNTEEDSVKVVSMAEVMKSVYALSPVGSKVPELKVPGTLYYGKKKKTGSWRMDKIKGDPSVIIFHVNGCSRCEAQIDAMRKLLKDKNYKRYKFFLIDMDELFSNKPDLANALMEKFDLSVLPLIIATDGKGRITEKYISLKDWLAD